MKGNSMKMSRRSAVIAGSIATLAVAGTLVAGPAIAKGRGHQNGFSTSNSQSANGNVIGRMGGMGMMESGTVGGPMGERGRGHGMGDMDGDHRLGMPEGIARGRMLHGEGVIASTDANGATTYITVRHQDGKVTAASDTSITVKSDDGYTKEWPISSTTKIVRNGAVAKGSAFVVGDVVEVRGTVSSSGVVTTDEIHNHAPRVAPTPVATTSTTGGNA